MRSLVEVLHGTQINEMAANLSKYRNAIISVATQILQNWCLVKLCDEHPDEWFAINRNYWASELCAHIDSIASIKLKSGRKDKVTKQVWIDELELDDNIEVSSRIRSKLSDENLQKYVNKIAEDAANDASKICMFLSSAANIKRIYIEYRLEYR